MSRHDAEILPFERLVLAHQKRMIERERREWYMHNEWKRPFEEGKNASGKH